MATDAGGGRRSPEADAPGAGSGGVRVPVIPGVQDLEVIGRGGFGVVYRGWQPELGREIAVKVISTPGTPGSAVERWRREITAMGRLSNHPNIVAVYSGGVTDDGSPYLVMPYVPGGSLRDRLQQSGPLTPKEVASFGARLAGALATAHEAGVLHRDVKPDNVLLSPYGEPQLTDFGIARLLDSTVTATSSVHATIPYAPPEVLAGQSATEAADVYGLGATLYACLTGVAPFPSSKEDSLVALVGRIASQPPPDLRAHGVPDALASVIERSLAKTPEERIGTADELRRRLEQAGLALGDPGSADGGTQPIEPVGAPGVVPFDESDEHTSVMPVVPQAATWAHQATTSPSTAASDTRRATAVPTAAMPATAPRSAPPAGRSSRAPLLLVGLVLAVLATVGLAVALGGGDGDDEPQATGEEGAQATTLPLEPDPTTPPTSEEPTTTVPETTTTEVTTTTEAEDEDDEEEEGEEQPAPGPSDAGGTAVAYFEALGREDLDAGYGLLTPEFQAAQSRASYDGYWARKSVEVIGEPSVGSDGRVSVPVRIDGASRPSTLTVVERDGRWLVDGPRPQR